MILHEEKAQYDYWLRFLFLIPFVLVIVAILLANTKEYEGFFVLIGDSAFFVLLFYFITPRRYQIHQDKLRIVLGTPFSINISLSTIKEVKQAKGSKAFVYNGIRFATSSRSVVEIVRNRGMNYVISPKNEDIFIEQLKLSIEGKNNSHYYQIDIKNKNGFS
jgi:hypothetical protein